MRKIKPTWKTLCAAVLLPVLAAGGLAVAADEADRKAGQADPKIAWNTENPSIGDGQKPVLLYFTADWCAPCKVMDEKVWGDDAVAAEAADYVAVKVDFDKQQDIARRFGVNAIPATLIFSADGQQREAILGLRTAATMAELLDAHDGDEN